MKTYKIENTELESAVRNLKQANLAQSAAKKTADNAKATIARILKDARDVELTSLPIGEIVSINNCLLIEIGKQNRFDEATFQAKHPALYSEFKRDFAIIKYKPLIG